MTKPDLSLGFSSQKIGRSEDEQGAPYWNVLRVALLGPVKNSCDVMQAAEQIGNQQNLPIFRSSGKKISGSSEAS
jgi:hypothetical protein